MKKIILLLFSLPFAVTCYAQTTGYIRNDTIKLTNASKNTTLIIETASKGHNWYLKDIGNGRTQFVEAAITDVAHLQDSLGNKLNKTDANDLFVPYNSASKNIDANSKNFTTTGFMSGILRANTTFSASTGNEYGAGLFPIVQQTGLASANILYISPRVLSSGGGSTNLINAGTNSANGGERATHNSVFTVTAVGNIAASGSQVSIPNGVAVMSSYTTSGNLLSTAGTGWENKGTTLSINPSIAGFNGYGFGSSLVRMNVNYMGRGTLDVGIGRSMALTNANTLYIDGPPIPGSTVTITNPWSIYVNSGNSYFGGLVKLNSTPAARSDATPKWYTDSVAKAKVDSVAAVISSAFVHKTGDVMPDSLSIGRKLSVYNPGYKLSSTISTVANQGLCTDGTYFYIVRSTKIYKTDASFNKLDSTSTTAIGLGGNHIGAPAYWNGKIYIPLSTFAANYVYSNQKIVVLDATSTGLPVVNSAAVTHTDNVSGLAVFNNKLWSANYVQGGRLQRYNLTTLASIDTIHLSSNIYLQQGICGNGTKLYIANESSIYSVDTTGANVKMVYNHNVYNSEGEGFCFVGSSIYWNVNYGLTNNQIQILTAGTAEIFKATQDGNAAVGGRFNTNRLNVGYASDTPPPVNSPMSIYTRFNTALVFDSGGPLAAIGHDNSALTISNNTTFNGDNWHGVDTTGFQFAFFEHKANKQYEFRISGGGASIPTWRTYALDTTGFFPNTTLKGDLGKSSKRWNNVVAANLNLTGGNASLAALSIGTQANVTATTANQGWIWFTTAGSMKVNPLGPTVYRNVLVNDVSIAANSYPRGDPAGGNVVYTMQVPDTSPTTGSNVLITSGGVFTALALKAPLASPTFTGTPAVPTPGSNINTTQAVNGAWANTYYLPKTGTGTINRAAQFNSSTGALEASAVTNTELGYISGVTSPIQTQLNAKGAGTVTSVTPGYGFTSATSITATGTMTIDTSMLQTIANFFPKADTRYQKTLVSGTDIKTINSTSLLGSGNIDLTSPSILTPTNIYSTSTAPSAVVNSMHVGTGYSITVDGNNQSGTITLTTGTSPSGIGALFTVSMSGGFAYPNACTPTLFPVNPPALGLVTHLFNGSSSATAFDIDSDQVLAGSTTYIWNYTNGGR